MKSRWYELKDDAIKLRKKGFSIVKIESHLGITRSTLSGWFKNVKLTSKQKRKLLKNKYDALAKARKKAVIWQNTQKEKRLQEAKDLALKTLENININNPNIIELALAFLYLGEGSKKSQDTALANSNPLILKFFLAVLKNVYNLDNNQIGCTLGLRADQDPEKMKRFWAKELGLPINRFKRVQVDKRTEGSKTYPHYKGVCDIRCGNVAIQRKLINIGTLFCQKIIKKNSGS